MILQENEDSKEDDESYVKHFSNWSIKDLANLHMKNFGHKDSGVSDIFVVFSNELNSRNKLDICIIDYESKSRTDDDIKVTSHPVDIQLGSSCLINIALSNMDIEVSIFKIVQISLINFD